MFSEEQKGNPSRGEMLIDLTTVAGKDQHPRAKLDTHQQIEPLRM